MTPAASWLPQDYYRASRAARRAWQATDDQLVLGLEEGDVSRAESMPAFGCGVAFLEPATRVRDRGTGERPESPSGPTRPPYQHEGGGAPPSRSAPHRQGGAV